MKTILTILLTTIITTLIVQAQTEVIATAHVELTPQNCETTCRTICNNRTIELTKDYYSETISY